MFLSSVPSFGRVLAQPDDHHCVEWINFIIFSHQIGDRRCRIACQPLCEGWQCLINDVIYESLSGLKENLARHYRNLWFIFTSISRVSTYVRSNREHFTAESILDPESSSSQKSINLHTPRSRPQTADAPDEFNGFSRISVDETCTGHAITNKHPERV